MPIHHPPENGKTASVGTHIRASLQAQTNPSKLNLKDKLSNLNKLTYYYEKIDNACCLWIDIKQKKNHQKKMIFVWVMILIS